MDKCDKIVFAIGAVIGVGLVMLVTNIRGYRKTVMAMHVEDYDTEEMISKCPNGCTDELWPI